MGSTTTPVPSTSTKYAYPSRPGAYDYWNYASQYAAAATAYPYSFGGYYANPTAGVTNTQPYAHPYVQSYSQTNYRQGQLQWQQPYQGPSLHPQGSIAATSSSASENPRASTQTFTKSYYRDRPPTIIVPPIPKPANLTVNASTSSQTSTPSSHTPVELETQPTQARETLSSDSTPVTTATTPNPGQQQFSDPPTPSTVASLQQISALASMQPSEIVNMLKNDPQLMVAVMAAINQNTDQNSSTTV